MCILKLAKTLKEKIIAIIIIGKAKAFFGTLPTTNQNFDLTRRYRPIFLCVHSSGQNIRTRSKDSNPIKKTLSKPKSKILKYPIRT